MQTTDKNNTTNTTKSTKTKRITKKISLGDDNAVTVSSNVTHAITDTMTIVDLLAVYHKELQAANRREDTYVYYKNSVHLWCKYMPNNLKLCNIDHNTIIDYILRLQATGKFKDTSINTQLKALRTLFKYAYRHKYMQHAVEINLRSVDKEEKVTYTSNELKALTAKPLDNCSFTEIRNWAIVNILIGTGVRLGTLVEIKWHDIDLSTRTVRLRHIKTRGSHTLPLSKAVCDVIGVYKQVLESLEIEAEYLCITEYNTQMAKRSLQDAVKSYCISRGVKPKGVHAFRHTFATKLIENNVPLSKVQFLGCWSTLDMIKNYTHLTSDSIHDYDSYNPLDTL